MSVRTGLAVILSCVLLTSSVSMAQTGRSVKRNVAAVLFSSLGGAILGLSTLPFYGEPQEHANNITTGALIGLVAGLGYVAYDNTRSSAPAYDYSRFEEIDVKNRRSMSVAATTAPVMKFTFDF
ncbi:hypothetical protein D3C87_87690 [compost metagenome]